MNCVIFDVDGTLATFDAARLGHLVHGAEKHWDDFHDAMADAPVIVPVVRLLRHLKAQGEQIVICSGRPVGWQARTEAWLRQAEIPFDAVYLRNHPAWAAGGRSQVAGLEALGLLGRGAQFCAS